MMLPGCAFDCNVMEVETALARAQTPRAQQRDVHAERMTMEQLQAPSPGGRRRTPMPSGPTHVRLQGSMSTPNLT